MDRKKTYLLLASVLLTLVLAAVMGSYENEQGGMIYGFPVDIFVHYEGWRNVYHLLGFLFNVAFYYLILIFIIKLIKKLKK